MASIILPYSNLGETLAANIDLSKIPHRIIGERSVLVDVSQAGPTISVPIDVQIPGGLVDVLPPSERKSPPIEVLTTILSVDAGIRQSIQMKQQKQNLYSGTVILDLGRITESAELCV